MPMVFLEAAPRIDGSIVREGDGEIVTIHLDDPERSDPKEHPIMQWLEWAARLGEGWRLALLEEGGPFLNILKGFAKNRRIEPESVELTSTVYGPSMRFRTIPLS